MSYNGNSRGGNNNDRNENNSGAMFRNKRKVNDNQPDYTGTINIEGRTYRVSSWINQARSTGEKFFSMRFTPSEDEMTSSKPPVNGDDHDDMATPTQVDRAAAAEGRKMQSSFSPSPQQPQYKADDLDDDLPF